MIIDENQYLGNKLLCLEFIKLIYYKIQKILKEGKLKNKHSAEDNHSSKKIIVKMMINLIKKIFLSNNLMNKSKKNINYEQSILIQQIILNLKEFNTNFYKEEIINELSKYFTFFDAVCKNETIEFLNYFN